MATKILSNVVATQIDLHAQYGGVFPELASREHIKAIYPVVEQALKKAHLDLSGNRRHCCHPWSRLARLFGGWASTWQKVSQLASGIPLVGVNHMEGHLYSPWLENQ